jgi:hypothetical protein
VASKRVLVSIGLSLALTLAAPAAALAAGTLDQQVISTDQAPAVYGTYVTAQVFTAGITGELDQVGLYLSTGIGPGSPADDLTVQIWTTTSGAPASPISGASATVLRTAVPSGSPTWVYVPIGAPSVAGTQYAIVLSAPSASFGDCPAACWRWQADSSNPYAGGLSYYNLNNGGWVAQARDQDFKTYVTPKTNVQIYLSGVGQGANGSVTSSPAGINCGTTCLAAFDTGSQLSLTAHPAVTATFGYWQGGPCDQSHDPVCSFTVPAQDVATGAVFYGIPPTQAPTPKPSATARPATPAPPKPTASTSAGASTAASVEPTVAPSVGSSPTDTTAPSLAPGATPGPTTNPAEPTSGDGSSSAPLILGVVLLIALVGAGWYLMGRRRQSGAPPPEA